MGGFDGEIQPEASAKDVWPAGSIRHSRKPPARHRAAGAPARCQDRPHRVLRRRSHSFPRASAAMLRAAKYSFTLASGRVFNTSAACRPPLRQCRQSRTSRHGIARVPQPGTIRTGNHDTRRDITSGFHVCRDLMASLRHARRPRPLSLARHQNARRSQPRHGSEPDLPHAEGVFAAGAGAPLASRSIRRLVGVRAERHQNEPYSPRVGRSFTAGWARARQFARRISWS